MSYRAKAHIAARRRPASPGNAPASYVSTSFGGGDLAVLGAHLDLDGSARGRTGRAQHLGAGHHHLHRPPGLFREHHRQRLEVDVVLPPKPPPISAGTTRILPRIPSTLAHRRAP